MVKLQSYCMVFLFCAAAIIASPAQSVSFSTLASFNGTDGAWPGAPLVQDSDGSFYGTTLAGGSSPFCQTSPGGCGTVFKMTPSGTLTTIYSFCPSWGCTDGAQPGGLVRGSDGNFYGTTTRGGAYGDYGTVFKITSAGALTTLHSFDGGDGSTPTMLVEATDGSLYGVTTYGGGYGGGTIFEITPFGAFSSLYGFCSPGCLDGYAPGTLVQGSDGNFYGTKQYGGANGSGTVFRFILPNQLTTLYSFCTQTNCTDGAAPVGLVQATDGSLYGTTFLGGSPGCTNGCGTVFKITPKYPYTLRTLYRFDGVHGSWPTVGPVQGVDGNFYGTTEAGGAGYGTVFKVTPVGTPTTLHSFCIGGICNDGYPPFSRLVQARNEFFYGTAQQGGAHNDGTVFSLLPVRACASCGP